MAKLAGAEYLHYGPLSSVAMHFIPVLAHAMPMLIITELERATRDPIHWKQLGSNWLPPTSWAVARISAIGLFISMDYLRSAETASSYASGLTATTISALVGVAGLALINRFLKHMSVLQVDAASVKSQSST
jgi:hypothetical protein